MTNEHNIFGKLCRFCGLQRTCGKYIFSTDALKIGLLTKIKLLFPEEVELINSDTILPKFICDSCEATINYFHEFRDGVKLVQQNLQKKTQDDISTECNETNEILNNKHQHICSTSRKNGASIIRLNSEGCISCFNCNVKLHCDEIKSNSDSKPPVCICCECGFKDIIEMFISDSDRNLICPKCTYMMKKKSVPEKQNTTKKTYECDICTKSFRCRGHLNRHRQTHYGSKPYVCEDCGSRFNQKSSLKTHLLIHERTNPFSCKWCGQQFRHKQTLANHVVSIHGVASESSNVYECDKCKKRFVQKEKLKRHYRSHSGEKPFKCNICDRTFTQKINLKTHYKKHEAEAQEPFSNLCQVEMLSDSSVDNQLPIQSVIMNPLVNNDDHFSNLTRNTLVEAKRSKNYTSMNSSLDLKKNEENYTEMPHSVLNEAEKGKLIQELLSFESMSPENDSLETFSSIVDGEFRNEGTDLKVSRNSNEMYFNTATSNYIIYNSDSSLYDLANVSQCSALPTFSNLNPVP